MTKKKYYGVRETAGIGNASGGRCNLPGGVKFVNVPFFPTAGKEGLDDSMYEIDRQIHADMGFLNRMPSKLGK